MPPNTATVLTPFVLEVLLELVPPAPIVIGYDVPPETDILGEEIYPPAPPPPP